MKKYNLANSVNLNIIETKKFKQSAINVRFLMDLNRQKACSRSMLAMMMSNRTKKYPSNMALTNYLDENYGLACNMNTYSVGGAHIVSLRLSGIDSKYLNDDINMFKIQMDLLKEVLFAPMFDDDGLFDNELFEEAKMILKAKKIRRLDDPATYAMDENYNVIGKDNYLSISCLGEIADIEKVSREDCKVAYQYLLNHAQIEIFVSGDVDCDSIHQQFMDAHFFEKRANAQHVFVDTPTFFYQKTQIERKIDQSSVILSWYNEISVKHPLYYAYRLANIIYGGDSDSLLFKTIREEHSFCYSIFSSVMPLDNLLLVYSGISYENKDQTIALMQSLMQDMVDGNFSDERIATAKMLYINNLKSQLDSNAGLINFNYQQLITNIKKTSAQIIDIIENVTKEDIQEAMSKCSLISEFVLKEGEANA